MDPKKPNREQSPRFGACGGIQETKKNQEKGSIRDGPLGPWGREPACCGNPWRRRRRPPRFLPCRGFPSLLRLSRKATVVFRCLCWGKGGVYAYRVVPQSPVADRPFCACEGTTTEDPDSNLFFSFHSWESS